MARSRESGNERPARRRITFPLISGVLASMNGIGDRGRPGTFRRNTAINMSMNMPMNMDISSLLYAMGDGMMYLMGPLLIVLALAIVSALSYTFFFILLPMMSPGGYWTLKAMVHESFVVFVLINVLVNYFLCVTTRNYPGEHYETVVRELADATGFSYPETDEERETWRLEWRQKLLARSRILRDFNLRRYRDQIQNEDKNNATMNENKESEGNSDNNNNNDNPDLEQQSPLLSRDTNSTVQRSHSQSKTPPQLQPQSTSQTSAPASLPQFSRIRNDKTPTTTTLNSSIAPTIPTRTWMLVGPTEWSYCDKSKLPKPPRSHYDHVTKALILNMDHYCPWMFNAVGYFNYRYFCNFLLYVSVGMVYGTIISFHPFMFMDGPEYNAQIQISRNSTQQYRTGIISAVNSTTLTSRNTGTGTPLNEIMHIYPNVPVPAERTPIAFTFMLCLSVGLAVLSLFAFHMYLILTGQTTVEFHGNWVNKKRAKLRGETYRNPYDLGYKRNLHQVWGAGPLWKAFLPHSREPEFLPLPIAGEMGKRHPKSKEEAVSSLSLHILDNNGGLVSGRGQKPALSGLPTEV